MQLKDFDNMYRKLTQNEKQGHLMLLDAPTGSGKSYSVIRFLCHQADKDPKFRSFFVTDQKKNLPAQENLMTVWCANHSRSSFFKRVAVIRSLEDTVQLILNEAESGRIPEELLNSKIRDLLAALKKKQAIYQQANKLDIHTSSVWRELNDTEYQFRQELAEKLADLAEADKALDAHSQVIIQHYVATQSNEICNWINRVYPTIEIERRQILMLTTDKFIRSYTPFFMRNSIPFRFAPALTNSLVVLDEFDSTKTTLLNQKIEDTMNASADLLGLFRTIHQGLKWHEKQIPVALQQVLEKQPRLDGMLKLADQYTESFKLSYLYRTKETGQNDSFLIHTPQYTIISNQRRWHSYLNSQKNSVELDYTGEDSLHFTEMLGKIGRFIRQFVQVMFYCAQNYAKERNAKLPSNSNGITTREACTTIYDALGFSRAQSDVLMNMDVGVIHGERPTTAIQDDHRYQFQNEGLYLYHFMNAEQHDLRTDINVAFLTVTPERYLLEIVKKANVLGLSATAKVPTVLDNYDLDYLHQRLGDEGYMDGRTVLTEKTKTEFDLKRRYQQAAVDVTAIGSSTQETIRDILAVRYDGSLTDSDKQIVQDLDKQLRQTINELSENVSEGNRKYYLERYIGLFDSFICFLTDHALTSYLGLQYVLPTQSAKMSASFIETVFKRLAQVLTKTEVNQPQLTMISTYLKPETSIQNQVQDALTLPAVRETRVYLLSAYQTLGIGQNLQHPLGIFEKKQVKSIAPKDVKKEDQRLTQVDLSGMYLGPITHVLAQVEKFDLNQPLIKHVIQLMMLSDHTEITTDELKKMLHGLEIGRQKWPKNTISEGFSYTRMIIQALGRMNRTFNKTKRIKILVFQSLLAKLNFETLAIGNLSPEVQAIYALQQMRQSGQGKEKSVMKEKLTKQTKRDLAACLSGGLNSSRQRAEDYQLSRENLLKYPTLSYKQLNVIKKQQRYCHQYLPNHEQVTSYPAGRLDDDRYVFDNRHRNQLTIEVSAETAGLTVMCQYPGFKAYMAQCDYATEWQVNDYILNPVQFTNLYKGVLGEVFGQFVVEQLWAIKLEKFEQLALNELFDFKSGENVAFDFKNWRGPHQITVEEERKQITTKLERLDALSKQSWRVVVINCIQSGEVVPKQTADKRILEVPALIDDTGQLVVSDSEQMEIGAFIYGE